MASSVQAEASSRLERIVQLTRAIVGERNETRTLEAILENAKASTRADGGSVYRLEGEPPRLEFVVVLNDTLGLKRGGVSGRPVGMEAPPLVDAQGRENHRSVVTHCALIGKSVRVADAYERCAFDFEGAREFDRLHGYRSQSFLTVPMIDHQDQVIGVLQLVNARGADGGVVEFTENDQRYIEALGALAAVTLDQQQLIDRLHRLFESLIDLINGAIDEKSPYTGGHCRRVPELTMMLAEAADRTDTGPLAPFHMTERDRHELKLAGMLHDCGKITTPVHVVDKATKLETIHDRIHELDVRFDVLAGDAHVAMLEAIAAGASVETARVHYESEVAALRDDRAFLHAANVGSERMSEEDVRRIYAIARREYRGLDGNARPFLSENEVANLTIRYGTLTADEREIINRHIIATIHMLEALPGPRHLRNVPEYAGGHHERMDGRGYPRGLKREQMSWQARMMGIADVFEALTAKDRPYKRAKTLSESMTIMARMAREGHLDPDLFDVFVRQKVYLDYAERFLDPAQIDTIDEVLYLPRAGRERPAMS